MSIIILVTDYLGDKTQIQTISFENGLSKA